MITLKENHALMMLRTASRMLSIATSILMADVAFGFRQNHVGIGQIRRACAVSWKRLQYFLIGSLFMMLKGKEHGQVNSVGTGVMDISSSSRSYSTGINSFLPYWPQSLPIFLVLVVIDNAPVEAG